MGDRNQYLYLSKRVPSIDGPILEIGSKDYGSTEDFRGLYPHNDYIGLDMEDGPGVDVVYDLTQGTGPLALKHFSLIICCSALEHVNRDWLFAEHVTRIAREGALIYMSAPSVWRFHGYPDDYFRYSWRGIAVFRHCFRSSNGARYCIQ